MARKKVAAIKMRLTSVLRYAHHLLHERVKPGDITIDATIGNGIDTLFLSQLVGKDGIVYGFDIQQQAIGRTAARFAADLPDTSIHANIIADNPDISVNASAAMNYSSVSHASVQLFLRDHAEMRATIPPEQHGYIAAVTFNLGYLPNADRSIITRPESTIRALDASAHLLKIGGIITIVVYSGHEGAQTEVDAVQKWATNLPQQQFQALRYQFMNQSNSPPFLIAIGKIA